MSRTRLLPDLGPRGPWGRALAQACLLVLWLAQGLLPTRAQTEPRPQGREESRPTEAEVTDAVRRFEADFQAASLALPPGQRLDLQPFVARMQGLVDRGYGLGRLWLLDQLPLLELPPPLRRSRAAELVRGLFESGPLPPEAEESALLHLAGSVGELDRSTGSPWALAGLKEGRPDGVRAAALWVLAEYASSGGRSAKETDLKEADELLTRLLGSYPGSAAARPAADRLCQVMERRFEFERERWWQQWTASKEPPDPALDPARAWWPRFMALADSEVGPALWWLVSNADHTDLTPDQRRDLRVALMERILVHHADAEWLVGAIQESLRMVDAQSAQSVIDLGEQLIERSHNEEVRAWALFTLSTLAARKPEGLPRAIEMLERLARELPNHRLARGLGPRLFALRHLQVGQIAPEVEVPEADQRSLRLTDYRGRVVALVFWGYWSGGFLGRLAALNELAGRVPTERFTLLGVNTDFDREVARLRAESEGLRGDHLWLGEPNAAWPRSWDIHDFPTVFLLDPEGRIRSRTLEGASLVAEIEALLAEFAPQRAEVGPDEQ